MLHDEVSSDRWCAVSPSREKRYGDLGIYVAFTHGSFLKKPILSLSGGCGFLFIHFFQDILLFII